MDSTLQVRSARARLRVLILAPAGPRIALLPPGIPCRDPAAGGGRGRGNTRGRRALVAHRRFAPARATVIRG
jgi:hypothetical protein